MKICIKLGIIGLLAVLLFQAIPDQGISTDQSYQSVLSAGQSYTTSQLKIHDNSSKILFTKGGILCDNADLSYVKDNKLRHLYPIDTNIKIHRPEKKKAKQFHLTAFPTPLHPISYYVFGLRKIVI